MEAQGSKKDGAAREGILNLEDGYGGEPRSETRHLDLNSRSEGLPGTG